VYVSRDEKQFPSLFSQSFLTFTSFCVSNISINFTGIKKRNNYI
jgi:hypothetical protein